MFDPYQGQDSVNLTTLDRELRSNFPGDMHPVVQWENGFYGLERIVSK